MAFGNKIMIVNQIHLAVATYWLLKVAWITFVLKLEFFLRVGGAVEKDSLNILNYYYDYHSILKLTNFYTSSKLYYYSCLSFYCHFFKYSQK